MSIIRVDSPELPLSVIPLCHLLLCHLGPPRPMLSINLYGKGSLCTIGAFHMSYMTLQICLIIALSIRCRHWRFGFLNGHVLLAWSIALYTQHLYTWPRVLKERWREERTGSSSLNFFQAVFTRVVIESSQPSAADLLGRKR